MTININDIHIINKTGIKLKFYQPNGSKKVYIFKMEDDLEKEKKEDLGMLWAEEPVGQVVGTYKGEVPGEIVKVNLGGGKEIV